MSCCSGRAGCARVRVRVAGVSWPAIGLVVVAGLVVVVAGLVVVVVVGLVVVTVACAGAAGRGGGGVAR
jgi:hypothetical protein